MEKKIDIKNVRPNDKRDVLDLESIYRFDSEGNSNANIKASAIEEASLHYRNFLAAIGFVDINNDPHMKDTPKRVAKMYIEELFAGCYTEAPKITTFEDPALKYKNSVDGLDTSSFSELQMVLSGPLEVKSMCSHHMMPIEGSAYVGVLVEPSTGLPGLSKYQRIVTHYSRQPQLQERLAMDIADHLYQLSGIYGVAVQIIGRHFCMCHRGVNNTQSVMVNEVFRGQFLVKDRLRDEFQNLVKNAQSYKAW